MKSVLLNDQGYTADGKWRLVLVDPNPEMSANGLCVSEAEHDPAGVYRAMIAASPAPELGEALPYILNGTRFKISINGEGGYYGFEGYPELNGQWVALVDATDGKHFSCPPAPALPDVEYADIKEMEDFVKNGGHERAVFFPTDAKTLAGFVLACCAEIRKLRATAPAVPDDHITMHKGLLMEIVGSLDPALNVSLLVDLNKLLNNESVPFISEKSRIAELEAENQALRADAERYRYMRGKDLDTINNGGVFAGMTPDNIVVNGEDLDQVIDIEIAIDAAKGVDRG